MRRALETPKSSLRACFDSATRQMINFFKVWISVIETMWNGFSFRITNRQITKLACSADSNRIEYLELSPQSRPPPTLNRKSKFASLQTQSNELNDWWSVYRAVNYLVGLCNVRLARWVERKRGEKAQNMLKYRKITAKFLRRNKNQFRV